jgi:hypothetical protein
MTQRWGQEERLRPLDLNSIDGRYSNQATKAPLPALLWTLLTNTDSDPADVIDVRTDQDELRVAREAKGNIVAVRQFRFKAKPTHLQLPTQHSVSGPACPVLWVWGQDDFAFGSTPSANLSVYRVGNGLLMLGPLPIFGAGGGPGLVYEFERMKE